MSAPELAERVRAALPAERDRLLVRHLQDEVAELIGSLERPSPSAGLFDLGVDSLQALILKGNLEEATGLLLPDTLAFEEPTIEGIARVLRAELEATG